MLIHVHCTVHLHVYKLNYLNTITNNTCIIIPPFCFSFSPPFPPSLLIRYAPNGTAVCVYFAGIENLAVVSEFLDEAYRGIFEVFNQNHFLKRTGDKQADNFLNVSNNLI